MASASTSLLSSSSSSSSSSTASPPKLKWTYDVFLSFKGDDTRKNFVDHLYTNLTQKGIYTFRDDERLVRGEEISDNLLKAIEESRFAIIIFSENYASSPWCLDELVHIIDCTKATGQIAYPVFYNVAPSNVRKQRGSFAEAFDKHLENNLVLGKIKKWMEALSEAGSLSGWDCLDRPEAEIIQKVVGEIFNKLSHELHVDDNLVGMEIHMEGIYTCLNLGSNDVKFVGIHGLGGIGKTTIAKVIYNKFSYRFKGCSYVANISERYKMENNLVSLQKQLLHDILKVTDLLIVDDDNGSSILKNRLNNQKVLIILDDVDHVNQLEKLAGNGKWFAPGSRIIITTRNQHLLSTYEVVERYNVRECDLDNSLEIFSWKAFKQKHPPEDYIELSKKVVDYTKGLPLALTVLGSHLRGRSKDEWEGAIEEVKIIPNEDVTQILKISYEGLNTIQKNLFLDIACFFNGEDKDKVMEKLHSFGFYPKINISVLIGKSLITVSAKNELTMHDLVRDMGRYIVQQESSRDPGKRSRMWNDEDICRVLVKNTVRDFVGTEAIEGIQLTSQREFDYSLDAEVFMKMKNLRFLFISAPHLVKNFSGGDCIFPDELKILEWKEYPFERLAFYFQQDKLVHLSLTRSNIKLLWYGRKDLQHLKSIDLFKSSHLTKIPDVTGLPNLERLSLPKCKELVEIDPSVWVHEGIKFLDLSDCYNLGSFPNKIEMESLETLDLYGCKKMEEFPEVHGNMEHLSKLKLSYTAIKELPSSIENFTALKNLDLHWCENLVCLPSSICKLKYLATLHLRGCKNLEELPENIGELKCLVVLDASTTAIKEVPASFNFLEKLRDLTFANCSGLELSSFNGLSSLTELDLSCCGLTNETFPRNIECLSSLKNLYVSGNNFVSRPTNIPLHTKVHA